MQVGAGSGAGRTLQFAVDRQGRGWVSRLGAVTPCFGETCAEILDLLVQGHDLGSQSVGRCCGVFDADKGRVQPDHQDDANHNGSQLDEWTDWNPLEPFAEE